jgi:hypothetical protein
MKNISRSRVLLTGVLALALSLSACSKSSDTALAPDDAAQTTSEMQSETTSETTSATTLDPAAEENMHSVQIAAMSFDRQLRSQAAFGTSADPLDTDPRRMEYILDMIAGGDLPDAATTATALANNQLRVLVWQGAGQASVKWTRIACPSGVCSSINSADGTLVSAVGENSKLYSTTPLASVCLQFHVLGQSAWMNISSAANTQSVISDVLETACPAAMFPGITAATGSTYADLSATPGAALVDPTW